MNQHIEAAAAAYYQDRHPSELWELESEREKARHRKRAEFIITAWVASFDSDDAVVEAMIAAFNERTVPIDGQFYGWVKDSMRAALAVARAAYAQRLAEVERKAYELWRLLDNIDTLDDACKGDDKAFRDAARRMQRARFEIMSGDEWEALHDARAKKSFPISKPFKAACGHMTTAKMLGSICPECHAQRLEELSAERAKVARLREAIERALSGNNAVHHFPALVEWRDLREALKEVS